MKSPTCRISLDGHVTDVAAGSTVLAAAESLGIEIPTLCSWPGLPPKTRCMLCLVEVEGRADLVPACATQVEDGLVVRTQSDRITEARRTALELMLSDHLGDCLGPCQLACPADLRIPAVLRAVAAGDIEEASRIVLEAIALPGCLGRICSAPCEKTCRRRLCDEPVAIRAVERFLGDRGSDALFSVPPAGAHRVAVVGSGPAGLAATWALRQGGVAVTLHEKQAVLGGDLRRLHADALPPDVLERDIGRILATGVEVLTGEAVVEPVFLLDCFDAVFVATGAANSRLAADRRTYALDRPGLFAGGGAVRGPCEPIRALADGRAAAIGILQFLRGQPVTGPEKVFNCRMGRLSDEELQVLRNRVSAAPRHRQADCPDAFGLPAAREEAARCLHCDCRAAGNCKLQRYCQQTGARITAFDGGKPRLVVEQTAAGILVEPGKCIRCGLCVDLSRRNENAPGLAFVRRGFEMHLAPALGSDFDQALGAAAEECLRACPTGALAREQRR